MKKIFALVTLMLMACLPAMGQAHGVALSWTASATVGVSNYNVYRAPCTGSITAGVCSADGTFAKVGNVPSTALTFTDTTVAAGGLYDYYVTAVCPAAPTNCSATVGGESGPSNKVATAVPLNTPLPPTGLGITAVSFNNTGANAIMSASWQDVPNLQTHWAFYNRGSILASGYLMNSSGVYSASFTGKVKKGTDVTFEVCDATGTCQTRTL